MNQKILGTKNLLNTWSTVILLEAVVFKFVVTSKCYHRSETDRIREEDLCGCIKPELQMRSDVIDVITLHHKESKSEVDNTYPWR